MFRCGDLIVDRVYAGDTLLYPSFAPVSMYKNGNFTVGTTFADVTDWTADAAYPATTLSGTTGLVVSGTKLNVTVAASISVTNTSFSQSRTIQLQLLLDGQVIATNTAVSVGAQNTTTVSVSTTEDVSSSQVVKLQAVASGSIRINSGTGSYVRVT